MTTSVQLMTEPQQVAEYLTDLLKDNAGPLGLAFVGLNDKLKPEYPAAVVVPGAKQKTIHATHTFNVGLEVIITVYHARLSSSHATRTVDDLTLVTAIENLIELGEMNFGGQVIFAYVREIHPGTITRPQGEQVVGTRLLVEILSQKRFPYAS